MAIFHLQVRSTRRREGRSACAAASYWLGIPIRDHRTGERFDYASNATVVHAELVLPKSACSAEFAWVRDPETLWNAAERAENRSNSRVAREYRVALPFELTRADQLHVLRALAQAIMDRCLDL